MPTPTRLAGSVVVHNGIIENYLSLKEQLQAAGHEFSSQTDTEVIAHLVDERLKTAGSFEAAVRTALQELQGAFAVCILCKDQPDTLIAAKVRLTDGGWPGAGRVFCRLRYTGHSGPYP
jgi:glutamine---fructose-6-phosphate transaminase (isomerizing)